MFYFWSSYLIWNLISSFSKTEHLYIGPFGKGTPGIKSIECLTWQCRGTPIGEVKMSLYSCITLSNYFSCVVGAHVEVTDVVATFSSL